MARPSAERFGATAHWFEPIAGLTGSGAFRRSPIIVPIGQRRIIARPTASGCQSSISSFTSAASSGCSLQ